MSNKYVQFDTDLTVSACWHCADPKCDPPVRVPMVDGLVTGCFCSFSCAKRWCMDENHIEAIVNLVISNKGRDIEAAPPRRCFKRFGGIFESKGNDRIQMLHPLATPLKLTASVQSMPSGGRQDSLFREFVKQRRYVKATDPTPNKPETKAQQRPVPKKKRAPKKNKRKASVPKEKKLKRGVPLGNLSGFIVPAC